MADAVKEPENREEPSASPGGGATVTMDLNESERAEWLKPGGKLPERFASKPEEEKPTGQSAEASEETHADERASSPELESQATETPESVETDKAEKPEKPTGKKKPIETRVDQVSRNLTELLREQRAARVELDRLRAERAELEKTPVKAEAKPEPPPNASPDRPKRPKEGDFKTWDEYSTARDAYDDQFAEWNLSRVNGLVAEKVAEQRRLDEQAQAKRASEQRESDVIERWTKDVVTATQRHDDYTDVVGDPGLRAALKKAPHVDEFIRDHSEIGAELLYAIGKDLADGGDVMERASNASPLRAAVILGKLEEQIQADLKPSKKPPVVPRAAKPSADVGGLNSAPADEEAAALERQDISAYMEAGRQKRLKALKLRLG